MNPLSSWWLNRRQRLARLLFEGSVIVDVGSRTERVRQDAIAVDIERNYHPDIVASAEYLPFRDHCVDYVSMLEVVEHLDFAQIDRMLKEVKRTGHFLVLSTPNAASISWNLVWYIWSRTAGRTWHDAHKSFFSAGGLASLLELYGFKIDQMINTRWHILLRAEAS